MKIELEIWNATQFRAFAAFCEAQADACAAIGGALTPLGQQLAAEAPAVEPEVVEDAPAVEPEVVEETPKRRGRPPKAKPEPAPAPEPEPVLAIQQGDDEPEEEEAEAAPTATRDDVRLAMAAYLKVIGEAALLEQWADLFGTAPNVKSLPEDPALFARAVAKLNADVKAAELSA